MVEQIRTTRLRYEREQRGWSRQYVAEQVEVDVATVGRWERGERLPYPHYQQKLCELFGRNALDLGLLIEQQESFCEHTAMPEPLQVPTACAPIPESFQVPIACAEDEHAHAPMTFLRQRRKLLIALGGLGTAALLIGGARIISTRAPSSSSLHVSSSKHLFQFIDPNTPNWVNNLAWSPDGNTLAAANDVPLVTAWNVKRNALTHTYSTSNQWVNDVAWSKSNLLAAATAEELHARGTIQIRKFAEASPPPITLRRSYTLRTVAWSPAGEYLAFSGHNTMVEIWGPVSGSPTSRYLDAGQNTLGINRVKWSSDGVYLAAAADDGTVHIWESATGKQVGIYQGHQERVVDIAWCPQKYLLASASVDKTARVWNALSGQTSAIYQGHAGEIHGIDWSPDGKSIVTAAYDATAQVWEALTGKPIAIYGDFKSDLLCALWSLDGRTIALGCKHQGIGIWQAP